MIVNVVVVMSITTHSRGVLRHQMGFHSAAIADLTQAVELAPEHSAAALFNRAVCHQALGNTKEVRVGE